MPQGAEVGVTLAKEVTNEPSESKHPSSGIVCPSQTFSTYKTCENQSEPGLENKVGVDIYRAAIFCHKWFISQRTRRPFPGLW
ncbi:hypothetical protein TNIN_51071 [Trichonephila inaurata madagascariensis]|uniref:Uncharacterized protein n=1 Tax=Trichonephila inaurata madagascariensis TaxID=2747483 RepID=A0A8X7C0W6_9ARAC|nr:hypothetical protein TNIN_51071 [Trichonephila inaurata madagascariensis]